MNQPVTLRRLLEEHPEWADLPLRVWDTRTSDSSVAVFEAIPALDPFNPKNDSLTLMDE